MPTAGTIGNTLRALVLQFTEDEKDSCYPHQQKKGCGVPPLPKLTSGEQQDMDAARDEDPALETEQPIRTSVGVPEQERALREVGI